MHDQGQRSSRRFGFRLMTGCAALALALAACGSDDNNGGSAAGGTTGAGGTRTGGASGGAGMGGTASANGGTTGTGGSTGSGGATGQGGSGPSSDAGTGGAGMDASDTETGGGTDASVDAPAGDNTFATDQGPLKVTPIMHASVRFDWNGKVIYSDPAQGDYTGAPPADIIVITHKHGDHLNPANIMKLTKAGATKIFAPATVASMLTGMPVTMMANGDTQTVGDITIDAVAMYNTTPARASNHPKGDGNGYVIKLGNKKVYVSGDTECTDELKKLTGIDVAFLCMNIPYTMDVPAAAACTKIFAPKVVYPYHYKDGTGMLEDVASFKTMVGATSDVRLANWYPSP